MDGPAQGSRSFAVDDSGLREAGGVGVIQVLFDVLYGFIRALTE